MQFVGNKDNPFTETLVATDFYPELKLADFQKQFGFLEDQEEYAVAQQALIMRSNVHRQLKVLTETHPNLTSVSQALFGDETTATAHYQNAVFAMTAAILIDVRLSTDATKEASKRQEALNDKVNSLNEQARSCIEMLKQSDSGYSIELI